MDHDHEVTPVRENKVQLFLRDSLSAIRQEDQKAYNLDTEFAKTRKNRDFFVIGIIAVVVVIVALISWFVTSKINESSRNVPVDIAVFEDINLKNVLDLAKKAESTLDSVTQEKISAQADYDGDMASLQLQKKSELDILSAKKMPETERNKQKQAIAASYAERERKRKASFASEMAGINARIAEAQKQVESFDKKRVDEARSQKKLLDNQQDLYELEKRQMKESYEKEIASLRARNADIENENARLKTDQVKELIDEYQAKIAALDPSFADTDSAAYITRAAGYPDASVPFRVAPAGIPDDFAFDARSFSELTDGYTGIDRLLSKIVSVPYENDVARFAAAARKMSFLAGSAGEKMLGAAFARIDLERKGRIAAENTAAGKKAELDAEKADLDAAKTELDDTKKSLDAVSSSLDSFNKAFSDAATTAGFDGLIFSVTTPETPALYLLPGVADRVFAQEQPQMYVYRSPKTLIATLVLARSDSGVSATVEKLERKKEILPFDFLSVDKK